MINMYNIVRVLGSLICLAGIAGAIVILRTRFRSLNRSASVSVGLFAIPIVVFYKILALTTFIVIPVAAVAVANYHTFEGVHEVRACAQCHVMMPMVNDLHDSNSDTLAARHFKNKWISQNQCYECHADYGLAGNMDAKMNGFRHLVRYTTTVYDEPIKYRGHFDNANCFKCHAGMEKFERGLSHKTVMTNLKNNSLSCLNCHGQAHPTRAARTPGSPDYKRLTEPYNGE
jgi:cytochrome c nitrite reductase small subunit